VPTLAELGYGRATFTQWIGVSAPRGLPPAMAERIAAAIPGVIARPEVASRLEELASAARPPTLTGAEFQSFVAAFRDHWVAIARAENIVAS
jgi:tripartite-type tricarboxylate transporter receptor subunit TctC